MRVRISYIAMFAAGALAAWVSPADAQAPGKPGVFERDVVEVAPAQGIQITLVDVDNRLGDVRVEGHDKPGLVIFAHKRAPDDATLERLKVGLIPEPAGPVRISTSLTTGQNARPIPAGAVRIDLVIRAPRDARVAARVWNGRLEVVGVENGADLEAHAGSIDVKNASGRFTSRLSSGKQHYLEIFGAVDAQGVEGELDLAVVRGDELAASIHDGTIDGRKIRVRQVTLRATRGDIRFHGDAVAGGHYRIGTYRGNIEVKLGASAPLAVFARSQKGRVALGRELSPQITPGGIARGTFVTEGGADPAMVELRSNLGNIQFGLVQQ